jgi:hypothetical protein
VRFGVPVTAETRVAAAPLLRPTSPASPEKRPPFGHESKVTIPTSVTNMTNDAAISALLAPIPAR